jgi:Domain of unknown function (DUF4386)
MTMTSNPGRTAGIWYLLLIVIGPLRLIYIPNKLIVDENAAATVSNIAAHERLFRWGMASELVASLMLIFLVLAFYRLFERVDRSLAMLVVIFGGLMPAAIYLVNVTADAGALMIVHGADFLSVFDKHQRDALALLLLRLHDHQFTATLLLAGAWLFPLGVLVYKSRFLPRFVGVWLLLGGVAWLVMCFTGFLAPQYQDKEFVVFQPAFFGEIALMLWLVIKGAKPPAVAQQASSVVVG